MRNRSRSNRPPSLHRVAVSACALAFVAAGLAGCGGSSSDDGLASVADDATAPTTAGETATTEESAAPTSSATDDVDGGEPSGSGDDGASGDGEETGNDADDGSCIEGDWTVSEEELSSYYAALGAEAGVPMTATGTARFRFIDLQFVYDAVFELEMDLEGQIATAAADGVATGSYVIEDGVITTDLTANSLNIVVNVGGFEMDAGDLGNDILTSVPINDARYSCDGPTIFFQTGGEPHPVKLVPYEG